MRLKNEEVPGIIAFDRTEVVGFVVVGIIDVVVETDVLIEVEGLTE